MATFFQRTMAFLGLVEEPYDDDYDLPPEQEPERSSRRERERGYEPASRPPAARAVERSNVRTISPPRQMEAAGGFDSPRGAPGSKVHVTNPSTFNDVEEVGVHFRDGVPVIMNLGGASESVAKRLLDFASGLIFGLDGRIERVGDRVFLLTPAGTDVSTEERRRLTERGFFNQA